MPASMTRTAAGGTGPPDDPGSSDEEGAGPPRVPRGPPLNRTPRAPPPVPPRNPGRPTGGAPPPGGPPGGGGGGGGGLPPIPPTGVPLAPVPRVPSRTSSQSTVVDVAKFDMKLKPEIVPQWDGNTDNLTRWILKHAENWFYSLPENHREDIQRNWLTLRNAIASHYMNRHWLDRLKTKANKATYRDSENPKETPSEYYIRKLELLELVYDYTETELISEILDGAPVMWNTILTPQFYREVVDLQDAIRYYEETLISLSDRLSYRPMTSNPNRSFRPKYRSNVNATEGVASRFPAKYPFPKDDSVVSKLRKTPEQLNVRPCRHCGSGKHWDNECKHSRKGQRQARVNLATITDEDQREQDEYDEVYYGLESDEEDTGKESAQEEVGAEQDFHESLQTTESSISLEQPVEVYRVEVPALEGNIAFAMMSGKGENGHDLTKPERSSYKPYLRTYGKRGLRKELRSQTKFGETNPMDTIGDPIRLSKHMSRPVGTSFLGSKATKAKGTLGLRESSMTDIIIDSGSDITLISEKALAAIKLPPKVKAGQRISLIQVTGKTKISGFVDLDITFYPKEGPTTLSVEAYVVKGMTAPFILGNDFSDQYSLSIIRKDGTTEVELGDSRRRIPVENSTSDYMFDEDGHAFHVNRNPTTLTPMERTIRRKQLSRKIKPRDGKVKSNGRSNTGRIKKTFMVHQIRLSTRSTRRCTSPTSVDIPLLLTRTRLLVNPSTRISD